MTMEEYKSLLRSLEYAGYSLDEVNDAIKWIESDSGIRLDKDFSVITAAIEITRTIDFWRGNLGDNHD